MVLAGLTDAERGGVRRRRRLPVGRGNEEDARAHDVVDGPPRPSTAASAWRNAAVVCAPVSPTCNAPPVPSLAVVPLTVIESPRRTARAYPASCSCPPPSKYRSAGDDPMRAR